MGLVNFADDDRELLAAEDRAVIASLTAPVETVDGGTVQAPVGSDLASLIELLNADPPQVHRETEG